MSTAKRARRPLPREKDLGTGLFGKGRRNVLGALFKNPDRQMYLREIISTAGVGPGQVQRELENLHRLRLILREEDAGRVYYRPNPDAPIFEELRNIVFKTFGVADALRKALEPYRKRIDLAFIYGSVARETDTASSDIDLMIVSDRLGPSDIVEDLEKVESSLQRRINSLFIGKAEFVKRVGKADHFLGRVLDRPRIMIVGEEADLGQLAARKPKKP
jgi:predicted nucleotidyltransferase